MGGICWLVYPASPQVGQASVGIANGSGLLPHLSAQSCPGLSCRLPPDAEEAAVPGAVCLFGQEEGFLSSLIAKMNSLSLLQFASLGPDPVTSRRWASPTFT